MEQLIEAMQIFLKYGDVKYPFQCEHDKLHVVGYEATEISIEDKMKLSDLGFIIKIEGEIDEDNGGEIIEETEIYSFRYGSA